MFKTISIEQLVEEEDRSEILSRSNQLIRNIQDLTKNYIDKQNQSSLKFSKILLGALNGNLSVNQKNFVKSRLAGVVAGGSFVGSLAYAAIKGASYVGASQEEAATGMAAFLVSTCVGIYFNSLVDKKAPQRSTIPQPFEEILSENDMDDLLEDPQVMIDALCKLEQDDFEHVVKLTVAHFEKRVDYLNSKVTLDKPNLRRSTI
ncbi:TPA: hypothetical protein I7730_01205 [Vibrio vulnificus]|uniref:Uncharacterized protein n=1 Tax=Vibrio vulnificus TaxID=672 RepID=A0A8H9K710_VIBVL|nr:hypothetical protein [Vibrio vulnificus]HAS8538417.1 hypothetical protein [Vibrio vulnificus]